MLRDAGLDTSVRGVLCVVGSGWPILFRKPLQFDRVTALWPGALPERVGAAGPLTGREIDGVAGVLAAALEPA